MKRLGLRPTIYAFGLPVPYFIRWPLMILGILTLGIAIVIPAIIVIPPATVLAAVIAGIVLLAFKYYFRWTPSRLEPQPRA